MCFDTSKNKSMAHAISSSTPSVVDQNKRTKKKENEKKSKSRKRSRSCMSWLAANWLDRTTRANLWKKAANLDFFQCTRHCFHFQFVLFIIQTVVGTVLQPIYIDMVFIIAQYLYVSASWLVNFKRQHSNMYFVCGFCGSKKERKSDQITITQNRCGYISSLSLYKFSFIWSLYPV